MSQGIAVNDVKPMSGLRAYTMLLAIIAILFVLFKPWITDIRLAKQELVKSEQRLADLKKEHDAAIELQNLNTLALYERVSRREVVQANNANAVQMKLQRLLKTVAKQTNSKVRQMRPLNSVKGQDIEAVQLDVNLDTSAKSLANLLIGLQDDSLNPELLSLSLRTNNWSGTSSYQADSITLNAVLQQEWVAADFLNDLKPLESFTDEQSIPKRTSDEPKRTLASLAGLFDLKLRRRDRDTDLTYYSVSAISISDTNRSALIQDNITDESKKLVQGDQLNGWTLKKIERTKITFEKVDNTITLTLSGS